MFRGPATINFFAADHAAAKAWYRELLGMPPYFDVPGYAEWRLGDYETEIGIIDAQFAPAGQTGSPAGAIVNWAVDDVQASLDRLLALGAVTHQPVTDRGHGFVTASVVDPFGNVLAVMTNPHYAEVLQRRLG